MLNTIFCFVFYILWLWSDPADAQADLSLRSANESFCWFCDAAAQFSSQILKLDSLQHWDHNVFRNNSSIANDL